MCLEGSGKWSTEIRQESIVLVLDTESKKNQDPYERLEFYIKDLPDLNLALQEAADYLMKTRGDKVFE